MDDKPSPYEIYCLRCQTSFPVGTRRCIHCGGRIAGPRKQAVPRRQGLPPIFSPGGSQSTAPVPGVRKPGTAGTAGNAGAAAAPDFETDPEAYLEHVLEHEDEQPEAAKGGPLRISLWTLSVGLALLGSVLRTCQGG